MPAVAILFFRMRLISVPEKFTPLMKISCKFGESSWCSFPLRALTPKISLRAATATLQMLNQSIRRMPLVDTITFTSPKTLILIDAYTRTHTHT